MMPVHGRDVSNAALKSGNAAMSPSLLEVYLYRGWRRCRQPPKPCIIGPPFLPGPSPTLSRDRSKIRTRSNSESTRHGGIFVAFLESPTTLKMCIMSVLKTNPKSGEKRFSPMRGHWVHGRPKLEKRTPNDADDAGPLGQHHRHHWGPVSPLARLLGCLCPLRQA